MIFQVGKDYDSLKSFKWNIKNEDKPNYIGNRFVSEVKLPEQQEFKWIETVREEHIYGMHPHISIYNKIFVETVGVGQSETAVHSMVDFFLLIQLSGAGDELQGIKRGIMEMADGIAINKSDGTNIEKSKLARQQYKNALHLFPMPESGWNPEVITCSAIEKNGIADVWQMILNYIEFVKKSGFFEKKRTYQSKYWMYESINEKLKSNFYNNRIIQQLLQDAEQRVLKNEQSSFIAANDFQV